ncbi:MAG: formylglycine-generating enzyme family protein [Clostridia bacterium]|nr:formylglycine-generating enzyme family protein [Clostridia bacterium]
MVLVEGGTFIMGAADSDIEAFDFEKPAHQVTLDSYKIGKFPVTQKQWESIMETNPSYYKSEDRPVERVTWHDAQDFIAQLNATTGKNYRLPTEAEWEFAARGGNESKGYEYSGSNEVNEVAWHELTTLRTGTQPVGKRKANELGIYDMSGNVNEWCNDWFGLYVHSHQTNPQGPTSGQYRVIRGGSCNTYAEGCKVISRPHVSYFGTCSREIGLRLVLPIEANEDMDDSTNI